MDIGVQFWSKSKAQRALNILPNLKKFVEGVKNDKKEINSFSYQVLITALGDSLLGTKPAFFTYIATELEPFLTEFQTDHPMAPFLYIELSDILKTLMSFSVPDLLNFVKKVLILSHGNASVERGFSVNKELVVENQAQKSLVAQRQVYDGVVASGGVHDFKVCKMMIHCARNARGLYAEALRLKDFQSSRQKQEVLKRNGFVKD
ncbi:hypothetical protein PR048_021415 [Dryococelus australis]|uniref:HAT C-terminal dimerisation domain-containing protein n=1 Tax=Dryococelus australis TaxID=614101 RepID=A0ABQ9GY68_9NEOP|nr:hypothetical protein PR048_021415 [Dryococelus australis]